MTHGGYEYLFRVYPSCVAQLLKVGEMKKWCFCTCFEGQDPSVRIVKVRTQKFLLFLRNTSPFFLVWLSVACLPHNDSVFFMHKHIPLVFITSKALHVWGCKDFSKSSPSKSMTIEVRFSRNLGSSPGNR